MFELWQRAEGDSDRYRALLRERGLVLRPGDEGYEDAPSSLPCIGRDAWWPMDLDKAYREACAEAEAAIRV